VAACHTALVYSIAVPIPFAKSHALGNDFLLVDAGSLAGQAPEELARRACDRHTGLGADGLVVLGESADADAWFRIFNADSSEAELSGNALRCAAAWLLARREQEGKPMPRGSAIRLATLVGPRRVTFLSREGAAWRLCGEIGRPIFSAAAIPFRPPKPAREPILSFPLPVSDVTVEATVLSMGNSQCVVFLEEWAAVDWQGLGAEIESHTYFPHRTNAAFARLAGPDRLEARFYERGAGHTLASGTGASAVAVAAHLTGRAGRQVTIVAERGEMIVHWRDDEMVELTGPAEIIATGSLLS
jgi:diaminopimelate epimerase